MRAVRRLVALAWLGAVCAVSGAAPVVRELPNGLRVVVSPEPGSGRVAAVLMVRAGDADDPPGAAGATRILSRLLMTPENHRAPGRFARVEAEGAFWSDAEPDVTTFSIVTTPSRLSAALRLLGLTVEEPAWNNTLTLRSVEREGILDREEAPDDWSHDFAAWQARALLPGPPASDPGPPGREVLQPLFERLYAPHRMVLAVAGDVGADAVYAEAEARFTAPASPAARFEARRARVSLAGQRSPTGRYAFVGYRAPAVTDPLAPAVEVLASALGRGKASRLFRRLRTEVGMGYESGVVYPRRLTESGVALFALAPGAAPAAARELRALWEAVSQPPEGGWDTARARAAHAYAAQRQTARDRAYWLAFWEIAGLGAAHDDAYAGRLRAVPDADLLEAARRYFAGAPVAVP